eukprot:m51a1_g4470 putative dual specificity (280) ;mRNA; f:241639-243092
MDRPSQQNREGGAGASVTVTELFNGLRSRYYVLDARPAAEYAASHIRDSAHCADPNADHSLPASLRMAQDLGRAVVVVGAAEPPAVLARVVRVRACVLEGGYGAWAARYPFLCEGSRHPGRRMQLPYPTEVLDAFLYLGGAFCVKQGVVDDLGITKILNLCEDDGLGAAVTVPRVKYPIIDAPSANIADLFRPTYDDIEAERKAGGRVLVHCAMGVSRSPTVVMAYLMRRFGWTAARAMEHTRRQRSQVRPNRGFVQALLDLEKQLGLSDKPSLDISEW